MVYIWSDPYPLVRFAPAKCRAPNPGESKATLVEKTMPFTSVVAAARLEEK